MKWEVISASPKKTDILTLESYAEILANIFYKPVKFIVYVFSPLCTRENDITYKSIP